MLLVRGGPGKTCQLRLSCVARCCAVSRTSRYTQVAAALIATALGCDPRSYCLARTSRPHRARLPFTCRTPLIDTVVVLVPLNVVRDDEGRRQDAKRQGHRSMSAVVNGMCLCVSTYAYVCLYSCAQRHSLDLTYCNHGRR